jgi:hypothetical protein
VNTKLLQLTVSGAMPRNKPAQQPAAEMCERSWLAGLLDMAAAHSLRDLAQCSSFRNSSMMAITAQMFHALCIEGDDAMLGTLCTACAGLLRLLSAEEPSTLLQQVSGGVQQEHSSSASCETSSCTAAVICAT